MSLKGEIDILRAVANEMCERITKGASALDMADPLVRVISKIAELEKQLRHFGVMEEEVRVAVDFAIVALEPYFDSELNGPKDLTDEEWRTYEVLGANCMFIINDPQKLWVGETTHRILDSKGIVHCVPFPNGGLTVLSWKPRDPKNPVAF